MQRPGRLHSWRLRWAMHFCAHCSAHTHYEYAAGALHSPRPWAKNTPACVCVGQHRAIQGKTGHLYYNQGISCTARISAHLVNSYHIEGILRSIDIHSINMHSILYSIDRYSSDRHSIDMPAHLASMTIAEYARLAQHSHLSCTSIAQYAHRTSKVISTRPFRHLHR